MKPIGVKGLNTRLRRLRQEFGEDSQVVKTAEEFIKERLNKEYLVYDKNGNLNISQSKEVMDKLGAKRWTSYDEYVPTVSDVYKREFEFAKSEESGTLEPGQLGPEAPYKLDKLSEAKKDPVTKNMLTRHAEYTAHMLSTADDIVDTLYIAKDDPEYPRRSEANDYYVELLDNAWLAHDLEWLSKVKSLTDDYIAWVSEKAMNEEW